MTMSCPGRLAEAGRARLNGNR